ncbi:MAG TPA: 3-hydroxyacyl-CoA dehydrogenase NAD-binding domain-containing protein, partial [Planctomycetota bacterium]|nr:3-hydroxyacyl-CoA dehydrogenase NAD-binding domain-containing protein [Planctomycetota bacterium]
MQASGIQAAAVIGAGTMGHGIAQALALCGIETRLVDVDE